MQKSIAFLLLSYAAVANAQSPITAPASSASSSNPPTFTGNPTDLVDWCFSLYDEFLTESGTPTSVTSTVTFSFPNIVGTTTQGEITETTTFTVKTTEVPTPYTPPPQCFTGCVIEAPQVLLEYWPTPRSNGTTAPTPTITPPPVVTAVVDGMTLISPSNYVVFTSLSAVACPLDSSPCTTIGDVVNITTLAFGQNELISEECGLGFQTINYADFNSPVPWSIVSNQPGCTTLGFSQSFPGSQPDFGYTLNPVILFPTEIRTAINPLWASCTFDAAVYDPPSALSPVQQLTNPASSTTTSPSSPSSDPTTSTSSPTSSSPASSSPASSSPASSSPASSSPADTSASPQASSSLSTPTTIPTQSSNTLTPPLPSSSAIVRDPVTSSVPGNPSQLISVPGSSPAGGASSPVSNPSQSVGPINSGATAISGPTQAAGGGGSAVAVVVGSQGQSITVEAGGATAVFDGQTVTEGGSPVTVSGAVISLGPSAIIVGSSTVNIGTLTFSVPGGGNTSLPTPLQGSAGNMGGNLPAWIGAVIVAACLLLGI